MIQDCFTAEEIELLKSNLEAIKRERLSDCLLDETEAGRYLKRSRISLWRMRRDGVLPYSKYGGRVLYKKSDLDDFIDRNYISNN